MLELSLFGQIPASRHDQVLKILAGVAAMKPTPTVERHLVFKPKRQPARIAAQVGGTQGIQDAQKAARQAQTQSGADLYYLRLVEDLLQRDVTLVDDVEKSHDVAGSGSGSRWSLRFYDVPEPGRRPVMARTNSVTPVLEGDVLAFMSGLGYQFVHQYLVQGHEVVHGNVIMHLHRVLRVPQTEARSVQPSDGEGLHIDSLIPLDDSRSFTLQAYVRIQDGSAPDVVARGTTELVQLKELLKGSIDLRVVDRLSLDTRVK